MDAKTLETLKNAHASALLALDGAKARLNEANEALKAAQRNRTAALKPVDGLATAERIAYDAYVKAQLDAVKSK